MSAFARFLIVLALLFSPAAASAQRATTGTVTGKIVDSSGAVLPGATVTVSSPEAMGQFTAVSDENGNVIQEKVVSGPPLLLQAALKAVSERKYEPTILDGEPTPVDLRVEVNFQM